MLEIIGIVALLIFTIFVIFFLVARAGTFSKKISGITKGMLYEQVIDTLGEPKTSISDEGIKTCVWSKFVMRGIINNYTIVFKDDKVISIVDH